MNSIFDNMFDTRQLKDLANLYREKNFIDASQKLQDIYARCTSATEKIEKIEIDLENAVKNCQEIINSLVNINPQDIKYIHFRNIPLQMELFKLASQSKKISSIVIKKFNIGPRLDTIFEINHKPFSVRKQCEILDTLAIQMFLLAKTYDDHKSECLLLLSVKDHHTLLSKIPSELITRLLDACIQYDLDQI